ncbi:MAG: nucleotide sugar dehydrogenase [Candidatus Sungiibacteriota bacterium]
MQISERERICVIGMGYVGLTLALVLAKKGFRVHGVEARPELAAKLQGGKPHFYERGLEPLLGACLKSGAFSVSESIPADAAMDVFIVAVGTPLDQATKAPMIDALQSAADSISGQARDGALVILRSTVPVGMTRSAVLPILRHTAQKNIFLAFCPERTIEGKALEELEYLPQIVGGLDEESARRAESIFERVTSKVIRVSSLEAAEMTKLIDNSYRDLCFAFANEIAVIARHLGLDGVEVIRAANDGYPRTNVASPGFCGGLCLKKDPQILALSAEAAGYRPRLVRAARQVNEDMHHYAAVRIAHHLKAVGKDIASAKIFISGFAFKGRPETDDIRDSPTLEVLAELRGLGARRVAGHDFVVASGVIASLGVEPVSLMEGFRGTDCVMFMNNHASYESVDLTEYLPLLSPDALIFDGWRLFDEALIKKYKGLHYETLG